jgi:hypothetical protein
MPRKDNKKKVRSEKATKKKAAFAVQEWAAKQSAEAVEELCIVANPIIGQSRNPVDQLIDYQDIQNAIELEKIGISLDVVEQIDASLLPPKLVRQRAREIMYPEVLKGLPTREEQIRKKLHEFEIVTDEDIKACEKELASNVDSGVSDADRKINVVE